MVTHLLNIIKHTMIVHGISSKAWSVQCCPWYCALQEIAYIRPCTMTDYSTAVSVIHRDDELSSCGPTLFEQVVTYRHQ